MGAGAATFLSAASSWRTTPAAQWNAEDAMQILADSPWAREIVAGVARRLSEDELRNGGKMGQPRGLGYDNVDPKGSGPKLPTRLLDLVTPSQNRGVSARSQVQGIVLRVRWESALPVQLAVLKANETPAPTSDGEAYRIVVYGIPGGSSLKGDFKKLAQPLKDQAFLKREGKKDVKPSGVEVFFANDGWAVLYTFPLSAEISPRDKQIDFEAHIGRIVILEPFVLADMTFQGKLEL
jgi:hypothetical protein